eukprot:gb/GECG01014751.1/.p1 GENE.gb/GECG01014751.1/~~gb/GECG01014751.1/.p1  ORF type:complete len:587 (+),score=114.10 gb/GECG01014751.1/:1-1761(+)
MASQDTESTDDGVPTRRQKRQTSAVYLPADKEKDGSLPGAQSSQGDGVGEGGTAALAQQSSEEDSEFGGQSSTRKLRPEEEYEGIPMSAVRGAPEVGKRCTLRGWLWKRGEQSAFKKWKRRWVVLRESLMYYYASMDAQKPKGIIALDGAGLQIEDKKFLKRPACFVITTKTLRKFYFHGEDAADTSTWTQTLRSNAPIIMGEPLVYDEFQDDDILDAVYSHFHGQREEDIPRPEDMSEEDYNAVMKALHDQEHSNQSNDKSAPAENNDNHEDHDERDSIEVQDADPSEVDVSSLLTDPGIASEIASTGYNTQMAWMLLGDVAKQSGSLQERVNLLEKQLEHLASETNIDSSSSALEAELLVLRKRHKEMQDRVTSAESESLESSMAASRATAELRTLRDAYTALQQKEKSAEERIDELEQRLEQLRSTSLPLESSTDIDTNQLNTGEEPTAESTNGTRNAQSHLVARDAAAAEMEGSQVESKSGDGKQEENQAASQKEENDTGQSAMATDQFQDANTKSAAQQLAAYKKLVTELRSGLAKKGLEVQSLTRDLNNARQEANSLRKELLRLYARSKASSYGTGESQA